jgi:hypothetical protein
MKPREPCDGHEQAGLPLLFPHCCRWAALWQLAAVSDTNSEEIRRFAFSMTVPRVVNGLRRYRQYIRVDVVGLIRIFNSFVYRTFEINDLAMLFTVCRRTYCRGVKSKWRSSKTCSRSDALYIRTCRYSYQRTIPLFNRCSAGFSGHWIERSSNSMASQTLTCA